jgi:hypothetical protein
MKKYNHIVLILILILALGLSGCGGGNGGGGNPGGVSPGSGDPGGGGNPGGGSPGSGDPGGGTGSSISGAQWTSATTAAAFDIRKYHTSVVFDNKIWVIGGLGDWGSNLNDVWYSSNGSNWERASNVNGKNFSTRQGHSSVVFAGKIWVIGGQNSTGGYLNDVWNSSDGETWTQAANGPFTARIFHTSVVFDNKIWVIGGCTNSDTGTVVNDVWSYDGSNWARVTANGGFPARYRHTSVVFGGKIWIIGGSGSSGRLNDVWYSENGREWHEATANAAFTARYAHASVAFNNRMWVIGGYGISRGGNMCFNDVWYSANGIDWYKATGSAAFCVRTDFTSVVFNNTMWVIAGENDISKLNDIWYAQ